MNQAKCAVHREVDAIGPCPRCGSFVCRMCVGARSDLVCPKCAAMMGPVDRVPTPWERRAELGFGPALWQTWKESMLTPDPFFRKLKPDGAVRDAMTYAWVITLIIVVPNFFLQASNFEQIKQAITMVLRDNVPEWLDSISRWEYAAAITFGPAFIFPISFYAGAGVTHLGCVLWGANKNGFDATARAIGYAQSAAVLAVIPVIGGILVIYMLALMGIGVARTQETTMVRGFAGMLTVPLIVGVCCTCGIGIMLFAVLTRSSL